MTLINLNLIDLNTLYLCRGYEEVPWDHFTPPKQWPPTSTAEEKPDQISHRWSSANKRYAPHAEEWQVYYAHCLMLLILQIPC